jgi:6-phosphogluconolactonase (cycloisomerase 2 family)
MTRSMNLLLLLGWLILPLIALAPGAFAATPPGSTGYLITNDDSGRGASETATFFTTASDGTLSNPTAVSVGGDGSKGGYFAANRVTVLNSATSPCVYLSQGTSNTIVGVHALTQAVTGSFSASSTDNGTDNGIGMVMNSSYLYASFSSSATVATFAVQSGCTLQFVADISPSGINGGTTKGMALSGNLLVLTYGDGSIESFDVSSGVPVSNGDQQNSSGFASDDFPDGVVISPDGHYAIFGDDSSDAAVEVSDISSGRLSATVLYGLPSGFNSNNVLLSPDGTLLYVTNNTSGQITALFFDASSGTISPGCISAQLNGFDSSFSFPATLATQVPAGTGSVLYVAEFGQPSQIGIINVSSGGGQCTLTEAASSPVTNSNSENMLSIGVVPTMQAGLYNPVSGSTLTGSSATFEWIGPANASAFWIDVGSTAGGNNYYQSGSLPTSTLSATVNDLPTNGSTVYVTLYWMISGSWVSNPYTYTAFSATSGKGALTTPPPNSTLSGSNVTFSWTAGSNATAYWLDIGNIAGGNQYYQSGNLGNVLSTSVSGLPTNGSTVYATLYSLINGSWMSNPYIYTAYGQAGSPGVMTTPNPGSTLSGSSVTFIWTAGAGVTAYWLDVGSVAGGNQYEQSGNLGNVTQLTVNGLPTDGSAVYATLYSMINGAWVGHSYNYTAFSGSGALAVMKTPAAGSTIHGNTATFTWSADASATAYWVDISAVSPGGNDVYQSGNLGNVLTTTVHTLPANSSTIYVTLYSYVGGQWSSTASTYTSAP